MEKLSGILASSPRVASVDMSEAPPARPGAPLHGRKTGRNTIADRVSLSQRARELASDEILMKRDPKEFSRSKKVEELNKKFFDTRLNPVEKEIPKSEAMLEKAFEAAEAATSLEDTMAEYNPQAETKPRLSVEA